MESVRLERTPWFKERCLKETKTKCRKPTCVPDGHGAGWSESCSHLSPCLMYRYGPNVELSTTTGTARCGCSIHLKNTQTKVAENQEELTRAETSLRIARVDM
jgi:hypothetical protein